MPQQQGRERYLVNVDGKDYPFFVRSGASEEEIGKEADRTASSIRSRKKAPASAPPKTPSPKKPATPPKKSTPFLSGLEPAFNEAGARPSLDTLIKPEKKNLPGLMTEPPRKTDKPFSSGSSSLTPGRPTSPTLSSPRKFVDPEKVDEENRVVKNPTARNPLLEPGNTVGSSSAGAFARKRAEKGDTLAQKEEAYFRKKLYSKFGYRVEDVLRNVGSAYPGRNEGQLRGDATSGMASGSIERLLRASFPDAKIEPDDIENVLALVSLAYQPKGSRKAINNILRQVEAQAPAAVSATAVGSALAPFTGGMSLPASLATILPPSMIAAGGATYLDRETSNRPYTDEALAIGMEEDPIGSRLAQIGAGVLAGGPGITTNPRSIAINSLINFGSEVAQQGINKLLDPNYELDPLTALMQLGTGPFIGNSAHSVHSQPVKRKPDTFAGSPIPEGMVRGKARVAPNAKDKSTPSSLPDDRERVPGPLGYFGATKPKGGSLLSPKAKPDKPVSKDSRVAEDAAKELEAAAKAKPPVVSPELTAEAAQPVPPITNATEPPKTPDKSKSSKRPAKSPYAMEADETPSVKAEPAKPVEDVQIFEAKPGKGRPRKEPDLTPEQTTERNRIVAQPRTLVEQIASAVYNGKEFPLKDFSDQATLTPLIDEGYIKVSVSKDGKAVVSGSRYAKHLASKLASDKVSNKTVGTTKPSAPAKIETPAPEAKTSPAKPVEEMTAQEYIDNIPEQRNKVRGKKPYAQAYYNWLLSGKKTERPSSIDTGLKPEVIRATEKVIDSLHRADKARAKKSEMPEPTGDEVKIKTAEEMKDEARFKSLDEQAKTGKVVAPKNLNPDSPMARWVEKNKANLDSETLSDGRVAYSLKKRVSSPMDELVGREFPDEASARQAINEIPKQNQGIKYPTKQRHVTADKREKMFDLEDFKEDDYVLVRTPRGVRVDQVSTIVDTTDVRGNPVRYVSLYGEPNTKFVPGRKEDQAILQPGSVNDVLIPYTKKSGLRSVRPLHDIRAIFEKEVYDEAPLYGDGEPGDVSINLVRDESDNPEIRNRVETDKLPLRKNSRPSPDETPTDYGNRVATNDLSRDPHTYLDALEESKRQVKIAIGKLNRRIRGYISKIRKLPKYKYDDEYRANMTEHYENMISITEDEVSKQVAALNAIAKQEANFDKNYEHSETIRRERELGVRGEPTIIYDPNVKTASEMDYGNTGIPLGNIKTGGIRVRAGSITEEGRRRFYLTRPDSVKKLGILVQNVDGDTHFVLKPNRNDVNISDREATNAALRDAWDWIHDYFDIPRRSYPDAIRPSQGMKDPFDTLGQRQDALWAEYDKERDRLARTRDARLSEPGLTTEQRSKIYDDYWEGLREAEAKRSSLREAARKTAEQDSEDSFARGTPLTGGIEHPKTAGKQRALYSLHWLVRNGFVDKKQAEIAAQFISSLPREYFEGLSVTSRESAYDNAAPLLARYNHAQKLITFFTDALRNAPDSGGQAAVHEIVHHLERFIPREEQIALYEQYQREKALWQKMGSPAKYADSFEDFSEWFAESVRTGWLRQHNLPDPLEILFAKERRFSSVQEAILQKSRALAYAGARTLQQLGKGNASKMVWEKFVGAKFDPTADFGQLQWKEGGLRKESQGIKAPKADTKAGSISVDGLPIEEGLKEATKRRYSILDYWRSPLSIYEPANNPDAVGENRFGRIISTGTFDEYGLPEGVGGISRHARSSQLDMQRRFTKWNQQLDDVMELLFRERTDDPDTSMGRFRGRLKDARQKLEKTVPYITGRTKTTEELQWEDFIRRIEMDRTDPKRVQRNGVEDPDLKKAIELHDKLTDEMLGYIKQTQKDLGSPLPDDWGVTEQGYFRHLFLGNLRIRTYDPVTEEWSTQHVAQSYNDALRVVQEMKAKDPSLAFDIVGSVTFQSEPTRLSRPAFWQTIRNLTESANAAILNSGTPGVVITEADAMKDLKGVTMAASRKHLTSLMKRKGVENFRQDYEEVMRATIYQTVRAQELSKLNKIIDPMIKIEKSKGSETLATDAEQWRDNLWGLPTEFDKAVGQAIVHLNSKFRGDHIEAAYAFKNFAKGLTALQSKLKLAWNLKSVLANRMQTLTTLMPYASEHDFDIALGLTTDKEFQKIALKNGLFQTGSRMEGGELVTVKKEGLFSRNWFERASDANKFLGYAYGWVQAKNRGLNDIQADQFGKAWAELTEFDNSDWNASRMLRSGVNRIVGQFKGFEAKNLERQFKDAGAFNLRAGEKEYPGLTKAQRIKTKAGRFAKTAGAYAALGGTNAFGPVAAVVGGIVYLYAKRIAEDNGADEETAEYIGRAAQMGLPSVGKYGIDMSSSVAMMQEPYGNDFVEKAYNFLGPTAGSFANLAQIADRAYSGKFPSAGTLGGISPYFRQAQAAHALFIMAMRDPSSLTDMSQKAMRVTTGNEQSVSLNPAETAQRALGLTPAKLPAHFEEKDAKAKITSFRNANRQRRKFFRKITGADQR